MKANPDFGVVSAAFEREVEIRKGEKDRAWAVKLKLDDLQRRYVRAVKEGDLAALRRL